MSEEIITSKHWLVLTNPTAGKRKFRRQSNYVLSELKKARIPYIFKVTKYSGHAVEIAHYYAKRNCINFLVLGGDGSISEVINGIFSANPEDTSKLTIAIIPRGTGNDWGRFWKFTKNTKDSLKIFLNKKKKSIDIGKIHYYDENDQETEHFFINSIGFGLDAEVVATTHRLKRYVGSFSFLYTISLLLAVFRHKPTPAQLETDGKSINLKLFSMNIANGPYTGGGIKQNPFALPYDGIFDMMVAEKPTLKDVFSAIPLIFNDKLSQLPFIKNSQAKEVVINTEQAILVEADGIIIPNAHNCKVSILPEAIQMIVP
ncbi:MAG: YegS/Rv2252/BmrU family lipid kinase [Bacteroidales bacterium]|nr:YegS/Rv2252/BmrU family lipid kinase [Bacteroidales bacterium]